jgi:hypothetical protein
MSLGCAAYCALSEHADSGHNRSCLAADDFGFAYETMICNGKALFVAFTPVVLLERQLSQSWYLPGRSRGSFK